MLSRVAAVVTALTLAAVLGVSGWSAASELRTPRSLTGTAYVGSANCRRCHADHYASWHRTFHRTMTQEVTDQALLGAWNGETLDYMGVRARMHRDHDGRPMMSFVRNGGAEQWQARVERTVGSHRYQQYLARDHDVWLRLPIAWDVSEQRFIHMNGAFLTPDPALPSATSSVTRADYDRHVTRWNDNCIFCHNVRPNPGLDRARDEFDSRVAELGVACEACHGPGAEHVARNANPVRRYVLHATGKPDPTIRNPARMTAARSAEVCGRCHGQRITGHIERYYEHGDEFIPGEDLTRYSQPLSRDTAHNGKPGVFAARFWPDGTPRLTAYEYQGYLQSRCRDGGKLTCESCHAMHGGEPTNQIQPKLEDDRMCTQCHEELASEGAVANHTRHDPRGEGSRCVACHMPKIVYGLVSMHVSHRIEVPDPARASVDARPDACTLCHSDRTRAWAAREAARLFDAHSPQLPDTALSECESRLLGGDPIERAAAASALGDERSVFASTPRGVGLLLDAMLEDPYPAVRDIASRSARKRLTSLDRSRTDSAALPRFVATASREERERIVHLWQERVPSLPASLPARELLDELRRSASATRIEIGE